MNCKPGDLAVIYGSECNDGHIVEVLRPDPDGGIWDTSFRWIVRCPTPLEGAKEDGSGNGFANEGSIPDESLRPIGGVPVHDEHRDEVTA